MSTRTLPILGRIPSDAGAHAPQLDRWPDLARMLDATGRKISAGRLQERPRLERSDITALLARDKVDLAELLSEARTRRNENLGNRVYLRGIVEISNVCRKNCNYCGIRRDNRDIERFTLSKDEILDPIRWAFEQRYGSVVLQAGERTDDRFVTFVEDLVREIKALSSDQLGITLSLGEQSPETYARWYEAGAHRYLLRIETSSPDLYAKLHPPDHRFDDRVRCLTDLRRLGYQVGTGVMIGLPGQTLEDLAGDVLFFRDLDIDMIGMGPYVLSEQTPLFATTDNSEEERSHRFELALRMIAACRLAMPDINIASTTALQALHPTGRELGLRAGANIVMPIITPPKYRKHYQLYQGKPCIEDSAEDCQQCLANRIESVGDTVGYAQWGDSPHALRRRAAHAGAAR